MFKSLQVRLLLAFCIFLSLCLVNRKADADAFVIGQFPLSSGGSTATLNIIELSNRNLLCFTITNSGTNTADTTITAFAFDIRGNRRRSFTLASPLPNTTDFAFSNDPSVADLPILNTNDPVIPKIDFTFLTASTFRDFANPGLAPGETSPVFCVTGNFAGLTQEDIAEGIYVRFARVVNGSFGGGFIGVFAGPAPEPGTMPLLGKGRGRSHH